ncbi:HlyD family efflux transporter periplasmic adaptor subunit [Microbulbifer elongatus]|uniref:HlyD family efflux transporter periplasmic adaptor subunit n=1 Tax=Microbulbifer elongatus TaxID=86173 RepID=A0ABT1P436_9GAMM|nr:HlyD family efflux transporter periplasmic adaptor subunit [Microbulbifer elongatus]MCQ3830868.1 HlyD family efflux transporter periplasmic adaptor subunit [Microbulbifer elongatus]
MDARLLEKLNGFLSLQKKLRDATDPQQIGRILCTDSQSLLAFDACLFFSGSQLQLAAASNVSTVDPTSSEAQRWRGKIRRHFAEAREQPPLQIPLDTANDASSEPTSGDGGRTLALLPLTKNNGDVLGCLALLRARPLTPQEQEIFREIGATLCHALLAQRGQKQGHWKKWFGRRPLIVAAAIAAFCVIPVRQSVLAPATLAAIEPRIVSARTDGVIRTIHIPANAAVRSGDPLFTLEDAEVLAEVDRVQQEISLYSERLRMTRQYNFQQASAGHKLAEAETDLSIRTLELAFQQAQLDKTRVRAPATGVAIYTDRAEWIGRRVRAGEKVMEVVQPDARQIQIDLPTRDAIQLPQNARVMFYAESDPLAPIEGRLHYHSLLTSEGEKLPASYRLLAHIQQDRPQIQLNTRGHARVYGARVPLIFYLLRRPLASARRWVGI